MSTKQEKSLLHRTCDALETAGQQLAASMRQVRDPRPTAVGTWSIGDTANHVSGSGGYFLAVAEGQVAPERLEDVDEGNAKALVEDPERSPRVLADRLLRNDTALIRYARAVPDDPVVEPFAGVRVPLSALVGIQLGEVLVHGFDIARGAGLPWRIDPDHANLAHRAYLPLLPYAVDADKAAHLQVSVDLRIRGMEPHVLVVENGALRVEPSSGQRVDVHMSVDPVAYLLLVWNRIPAWKPLLRGHMLVWGRRPWMLRSFQSAVEQ